MITARLVLLILFCCGGVICAGEPFDLVKFQDIPFVEDSRMVDGEKIPFKYRVFKPAVDIKDFRYDFDKLSPSPFATLFRFLYLTYIDKEMNVDGIFSLVLNGERVRKRAIEITKKPIKEGSLIPERKAISKYIVLGEISCVDKEVFVAYSVRNNKPGIGFYYVAKKDNKFYVILELFSISKDKLLNMIIFKENVEFITKEFPGLQINGKGKK